nr:hypothetical protein [Stackebrandtia nassauensis]
MSGVHLNLLPGGGATAAPGEAELAGLSEGERERTLASWRRQAAWDAESAGYAVVQATRPRTLSYALTDSPVGQLAWIAEKFREWSDPECVIDRDLLLTNVMLYWLTRTAGSSAAIYYERAHTDYGGDMYPASQTPTALAVFAHDNFIPLRHVAERTNNIVRWTEYGRGGHFPALEVPETLVGDVREFFRAIRP